MKKRKIDYLNLGLILMGVLMILLVSLLPIMHSCANAYRSQFGVQNGFGGEYLVVLLPLIYLPIYKSLKK